MRIPIALAAQLQSSLSSSSPSSSGGRVEESLSISGPSVLRSCIPATFNWTPTYGPYTLSLIQHRTSVPTTTDAESEVSVSEKKEEEMILVTDTKATWIVDIQPGSNITLLIKDFKGNSAESLNWIVEEGISGCLEDLN
ncbi:uncharacterized protein I303_104362 [Kwoniella dejecticola CBS 10117]|uniref:Uncharacterized protein n=1 Tax=Kwoniella dejecticola CBS 10117 TaxID=1296121 RepID=A0A1A6A5J0_9TREE|nr:uncharacterized protein I303_04662 [Kwoniella dejecticola CBS 10117]OBR85327.1 hypothetical protein I303_04662 [Kwoniella dejecticola CBS 10117]